MYSLPACRCRSLSCTPNAVAGAPDWVVFTEKTGVIAKVGKPRSGLTAGFDAIWSPSCSDHALKRIDPASGRVVGSVPVGPAESEGDRRRQRLDAYRPNGSAVAADWISSTKHNLLIRVGARSDRVTAKVNIELNHGDGTISRVDTHSVSVAATIPAGVSGTGCEIAYGEGFVWFTMMGLPLTKIDPTLNRVVQQWTGPGGDSVRAALGSVSTRFRKDGP